MFAWTKTPSMTQRRHEAERERRPGHGGTGVAARRRLAALLQALRVSLQPTRPHQVRAWGERTVCRPEGGLSLT